MSGYFKIGVLILGNSRILLCRKRHKTGLLILPGGCVEPGESACACIEREIREELGDVRVTRLEYLGQYSDRAAGEPAKIVCIDLYRGDLIGDPEPHSEIAELLWFGEADDRGTLAPSLRNKILPDLIARRILPWKSA